MVLRETSLTATQKALTIYTNRLFISLTVQSRRKKNNGLLRTNDSDVTQNLQASYSLQPQLNPPTDNNNEAST